MFRDKELQGKCLRMVSTVTPVKLYCCYVVNMGLTVAVITIVALSVSDLFQSILFTFTLLVILRSLYCMEGLMLRTPEKTREKFLFSGNLGSSRKMQ